MTSSISYFHPAQRNVAARSLQAHVRAVALRSSQPSSRTIAADAAWMALRLLPAALLFVSVLGV